VLEYPVCIDSKVNYESNKQMIKNTDFKVAERKYTESCFRFLLLYTDVNARNYIIGGVPNGRIKCII